MNERQHPSTQMTRTRAVHVLGSDGSADSTVLPPPRDIEASSHEGLRPNSLAIGPWWNALQGSKNSTLVDEFATWLPPGVAIQVMRYGGLRTNVNSRAEEHRGRYLRSRRGICAVAWGGSAAFGSKGRRY